MAGKTFITRTITATVFSVVLISGILLSHWMLAALFLFFSCVGMAEFDRLHGKLPNEMNLSLYLGGIVIFGMITFIGARLVESNYLALALVLLPLQLIADIFLKRESARRGFANLMSWAYLVVPLSLLIPLGFLPGSYSPWLVLGYFFLLWANDTGAFLVGKSIGKRKLAPKISPGKTWEGFIGGIGIAILIAYLNYRFIGILELNQWIVCAIITAVFGTTGDLVESSMKRASGVKDSGTLLPGHGGVLDRFDGLFTSLPLVFAYLYFIFYNN